VKRGRLTCDARTDRKKGGEIMATCRECKKFFPIPEDPKRGDCVQRVVDPRQSYYKARPVNADRDAASCPSFQKK